MKLKLALLAAAGTLALAPAAFAGEGYYGALGAGISFGHSENDFEDNGRAKPASFSTDYDTADNVAVRGALGKYFGNNVRAEVEFAHRNHDIDALPGDGLGFAGFNNINGDFSTQTLMLNVYRDFDFGSFDPYVGLGIGVARFRPQFENLSQLEASVATDPYRVVVSDVDYEIAGKAIVGATYALQDNLDLDVSYHFTKTGEFDYGGYINNDFAELDSEVTEHELFAGLRWNFGAPAAPVPVAAPAPAPVAAPQYRDCADGSRVLVSEDCPVAIVEEVEAPADLDLTVYFDYDKSNLTSAAQSLIAAKSAEAKEYDISSVVVEGNTDTSGSASYNQALSARRAAVVRDALTANGIDGGLISVQALGETNLEKPTADGVREPLNRRTDVTFNF